MVSRVEKRNVFLRNCRFLPGQSFKDRRERLDNGDRRVARDAARSLLGECAAQGDGHGCKRHSSAKLSVVWQGHDILRATVTRYPDGMPPAALSTALSCQKPFRVSTAAGTFPVPAP